MAVRGRESVRVTSTPQGETSGGRCVPLAQKVKEEPVVDDHPNVIAGRESYEAFNDGDIDVVRQFLADDIVRGLDEVLGLFGEMFDLSGGTYRVELVDVYASDDRTVAVEHSTGSRNGKSLDESHPVVFEGDVGKTREAWTYHFDDQACADFWS